MHNASLSGYGSPMNPRKLPPLPAVRSDCPIANALDRIGDRWTLLLIRDIGLFGKRCNKEFQNAPEAIPSNILAARLRRMVEHGLLEKRIYQARPPRYEYHLTAAGQALLPVLRAMADWAAEYVGGVRMPDTGGAPSRPDAAAD